jgi:hypothetical protein
MIRVSVAGYVIPKGHGAKSYPDPREGKFSNLFHSSVNYVFSRSSTNNTSAVQSRPGTPKVHRSTEPAVPPVLLNKVETVDEQAEADNIVGLQTVGLLTVDSYDEEDRIQRKLQAKGISPPRFSNPEVGVGFVRSLHVLKV